MPARKIEDYALVLTHSALATNSLPDGHLRREEMLPRLQKVIEGAISQYDTRLSFLSAQVGEIAFEQFVEAGLIRREEVDWAGTYYRFMPSRAAAVRDAYLKENTIHREAQRIGGRYYPDVFNGYISSIEAASNPSGSFIPAADREVRLDHNSSPYTEISDGFDTLYEAIRGENSPEFSGEDKSWAVATVSAARELWRATELKEIQLRVGVKMALEDVGPVIKRFSANVAFEALLALLKAFCKHHLGLDWDNL